MGIRLKLNLVLLAVAAVGLGLFALIFGPILTELAREEALVRSRIMMESAAGIRKYTSEEIAPLLTPEMKTTFHAQAVSSYAAMRNLSVLLKQFPDYTYREAALNPTNLADRATESEVDIISDFRANPGKTELRSERETHIGRVLFLSRPLTATAKCLTCHDTPERAPEAMVAIYGRQNGYGWKLNEIVGAQIVSVPIAVPLANAAQTLYTSLLLLAAILAILILLINLLVDFLIIRPIIRMSQFANDVSMGKPGVEEYVKSGSDEVASLSDSLIRMKRSMDVATRILGAVKD